MSASDKAKLDDELTIAESWLKAGKQVAIATVISTWGSAPRPSGSHLVIDEDGNFAGSVSGGCVEGAVVAEAIDIIASGEAKMLEFGVADETAFEVGLSCGGNIRVYVERLGYKNPLILEKLNKARYERKACVVVTNFTIGRVHLVIEGGTGVDDTFKEPVAKAFQTGKASTVKTEYREFLVNPYLPPPRIIAIGAVHITQAMAPIAKMAGYDLEVIDPRTAFATPERFEGTIVRSEWPEDILAEKPLDTYCALAAVTHDPKIDDFPIAEALRQNCFYVGALGSRKTHAKRVERLLADGITQEQIERIKAPIGLDVGAVSPQEIAIAVMAEIIEAFRKRELG